MSAPAIERAVDHLDVDGFWERGYAILPGVYTPEEIEAFREAAYASRGYGGDLLANPRLRSVITDGRMAAVARKLLGTDELFYSGDSSFTINGTQKGWHKDNADRIDPAAPDWVDRYTQLRFGIYCQDHSEHTGGLNLRIGSHDMRNTTEGEKPLRQDPAGRPRGLEHAHHPLGQRDAPEGSRGAVPDAQRAQPLQARGGRRGRR